MIHKDNIIKDMLKNIPDPRLREQYGSLLNGSTAKQVHCMSEDVYGTEERVIKDENDKPVRFKSGKREGEVKTETVETLVRKGCKGRVIATIQPNGLVVETAPEESPTGAYGMYSSGLEGSRLRLDGQYGFRCYCGNNSILCEEEKGVITPAPPSEADLNTIALRLSKRTNLILPKVGGKTTVDGFVIEEVKA